MLRAIAQLLVVALVLGAPSASAVDVEVRMNMLGKYEDLGGRANSGRSPKDVSLKVGPDIRMHPTQGGKLDFDFGYRPEFEYFFTNREFNDNQVDHFVNARFSYSLSGQTTLFGTDSFSLLNNPRRDVDETPDQSTGEADLSLRNEQNIFNNLTVGLSHVFTPRISGTIDLAHSLRMSENPRQSDSSSISSGANLRYTFSSRSSIGLGFNVNRQTYAESETRGAGGSTSVRFFGIYTHRFSPTLSFNASAGPLWIKPDAAETSTATVDAPRFPFVDVSGRTVAFGNDFSDAALLLLTSGCTPTGSGLFTFPCRTRLRPNASAEENYNDNQRIDALSLAASDRAQNKGSLNLFANMSLNKRWERSQLGFSLRREEAQAIGDGVSAVTTQGVVSWSWEPGERWRILSSFSYSMRESTADTFRSVRVLRASTVPGLGGVAETAPPGLGSIMEDSGNNLETMVFQARMERRLTRRLRGFVTFLWRDQSTSNEGGLAIETQDMSATIGLVYQFPTLHF